MSEGALVSEVIRQQSMQPPEQAKALLFDCDGTLVDTISLYRSCWHQVFGRYGFEVTDIWFDTWAGHSVRPFVSAALPNADEEKISQVADEGVNLFLSSTHLLKPHDHVLEIARDFYGRLPMAVVSGGPQSAVFATLEAVGIRNLFDVIVTANDVQHGKPAPDAYLRAIALLDVKADECVAYEDTESGMKSAWEAGVPFVVDVRQHLP